MADNQMEAAAQDDSLSQSGSMEDRPVIVNRTSPDDLELHYDYPWLTSISRPLLIAVLTGSLTVALLTFLRYAISGIPILYTGVMLLLTVTATIAGCASTTWMAQPTQRMKRNAGLRLAEFGLLFGLTRLLSWITVGNWPSLELFLTRPLESMLDGAFILSLVVVGLAWGMASSITGDFLKISLQPDELYAAQQRTGRSSDDPTPPNYTNRRAVLSGFVSKWMIGGVFMVLLSAGTQLQPSDNGFFALGRQNIDPVVIAATVLYFLTGLILISQGQFAVLRARWTIEKVPSADSVVRNWPLYGTLLIGAIGLVATMLPFGGTFYFAQILTTIIRAISSFVLTAMQIVLGIFGLFLSLFLGESEDVVETPAQEPIQPFQMPEPTPETTGPPPWLGGTIFWIIITLLLGYALYIYLSGRGVNLVWLRRFWALLIMRIRELFGAYGDWRATRNIFSRKGDNDEGMADGTRPPGWLKRLRLSDLNPDQQVRYFYMTLLEEAQEAGMGRRHSETPNRYSPRLTERLHPVPAPLQDSEVDTDPESDEGSQEETSMMDTSRQGADSGSEIADSEAERNEAEGGEMSPAEQNLARQKAMQATQEQVDSLTDAFLRVRYAGTATDPTVLTNLRKMWEELKNRIGRAST
ncbi:MAG: hypothetical protein AAF702_13690 [Chloroflexota bacterium]